jgi:hypothetical protein
MKRWPPVLLVGLLNGAIFTGLFVASWVAFFFGDGDGERAGFCTAVELLAGPLLVGSVQALRGRPSGPRLLRVGSFLFLPIPAVWRALRHLEHDPSYIQYMATDRWADEAQQRVEFCFPVYVLQDPTGLVLCTEEPDGGYLAVFTGPGTAARFREVRQATDWTPTPFSQTQLSDLLHSARHTGRVEYVMIDPLSDGGRSTPVFPLSHCIECLCQ